MRRESDPRLRDLLVKYKLLDKDSADRAMELSGSDDSPDYVDVLLSRRLVEERKLLEALAAERGWPIEDIEGVKPAPEALRFLLPEIARKYVVLPLRLEPDGTLVLAVSEGITDAQIEELRFVTGRPIRPVLSTARRIQAAVYQAFEGSPEAEAPKPEGPLEDLLKEVEETGPQQEGESPVVKEVHALLEKAVELGATDFHIDRTGDALLVRFRSDDRTLERRKLPATLYPAVVTRLKIVANMDIMERRMPQDGKFTMKVGDRTFDFMVATLPTERGERAVVRLVELERRTPTLEEMEAPPPVLDAVREALRGKAAFILALARDARRALVFLRSLLSEVDAEDRIVIGITEPSSPPLPGGAVRVKVDPETGLTFGMALRAALRHEPDLLMIEEIRDRETLDMALQAVRRGVGVVGHFRVGDAVAVLRRCLDMGIDPEALANGLGLAIEQVVVPRLCQDCRRRAGPGAWKPAGCPSCVRGYRGEVFLYPVLKAGEPLRKAILAGADAGGLASAARECGWRPPIDLAREMIGSGIVAAADVPGSDAT